MNARPDVLGTQDGRHTGASVNLEPGRMTSILKADGLDARPSLVTISWSVAIPFQGAPAIMPGVAQRIEGVLDFGNHGASHTLNFDWCRGGALTITATAFHLKARLESNTPLKFNVQAAASYMARPGNDAQRVTATTRYTVAAARPETIYVTSFAHLVTIHSDNITVLEGGGITLEMLTLDGSVFSRHTPRNSRISDAVEIPNEVVFVRVTTTSPDSINGGLMYHLAI